MMKMAVRICYLAVIDALNPFCCGKLNFTVEKEKDFLKESHAMERTF